MKRKSLSELKELILLDIEKQNRDLEEYKENENPQVKELYTKAETRIEAMESVLAYIEQGSKIYFDK